MGTSALSPLPGGPGVRRRPAGLAAGAPLTRVTGPAQALDLVAADLVVAERELHGLLQSDVRAVPSVSGYLAAAGGKRLRPALTGLGALAIGAAPQPRLMCVGELIHLGSLLHDDVVDDADTRRGKVATHRVFGNAVTVLTGDFCLARAVLLAAEEGGHAAVSSLAEAVTRMAEGEVLQLQRAGDLGCTRSDYFDVIERKSAALIAWCASAAAHGSGRTGAAEALALFGRRVGVAFQITDDVLDYRAGTGKAPGADLRQRKVTLPLLLAMDRIPSLRDELEQGEPSPADITRWIQAITATGALEAALDEARCLVDEGLGVLDELPAGPGRDALRVLGRYLVERAE